MECYLGASHLGTPGSERFVRTQLATTTDIACPWWPQWVHGGLDMQTTHHLFPRLPRDALARARPLVQAFCDVRRCIEKSACPCSFSSSTQPPSACTSRAYRCTLGGLARPNGSMTGVSTPEVLTTSRSCPTTQIPMPRDKPDPDALRRDLDSDEHVLLRYAATLRQR